MRLSLLKQKVHNISVVVDRVVVKPEAKSRIADSVQIALKKADGVTVIDKMDEEIIYSEKLACPDCNLSFEELSPRIFSFNAPYGACENAAGLVWILKLILIWLFLISQNQLKMGRFIHGVSLYRLL